MLFSGTVGLGTIRFSVSLVGGYSHVS